MHNAHQAIDSCTAVKSNHNATPFPIKIEFGVTLVSYKYTIHTAY